MRGVNKVILVGTLGRDPETKTFPNGVLSLNFLSQPVMSGQTKTQVSVKSKQSGIALFYITV